MDILSFTWFPGEAAEQSVELPTIWDAIAPMWHQCNGFGKSNDSIKKAVCRKFSTAFHYNPRFVRSVQVVEINHQVLRELPHVFPAIWQRCVWYINEHKPCPCVSWIATPWYLMENILFIQLSHNNMFHQYFWWLTDQINPSEIGCSETCFYLFCVILQ